ncbi:unnamed protein product [Rotaria sp. Silwood2]|nr:unnamed protein product [Rotaria sp. Silwood2]
MANEVINDLITYSRARQIVQEVFSSVRTVLSLNGSKFEQKRYEKELDTTRWNSIRQGALFGIFTGWLFLSSSLAYSVGFIFGSLLISPKFSHSLNISDILVGKDTSINEIDVWQDDTESNYNVHGDIQFDNVSFIYPSRNDALVLHNLSLTARAGQITALVGSSGSGKSTCISLLLRYYEPLSGQITIDDRPIKDYNVKELRQNIGVVSQEPILFGVSIYENIRFGKVDATRAEIEQAAREANAHHFIMQLPNKYETLVGERGIQLSGGEKQRIALARALVKQPTFLLLDEATSALDNVSEKIVQEALDRACKGRTTFVIAHRLTTIQNAHQIYVLDNGSVIEQGTHETLMAKDGGKYKAMVKRQQTENINDDKDDMMTIQKAMKEDEKSIYVNEKLIWEEDSESFYNIDGDVEFDNINFTYPSRKDTSVLCNLSFIARAGQTTALVGSTGSGKSTCISLILRYYEPSSGRITIDGRQLTDYNVRQLRQSIGVVSQEPILFGITIYENIRFGKVNATRAEIEQAAREANVHNFVMQLPNKYETLVGERGIQLSGGEKQRIALARALVKQPKFLLLDEATSALDNISEKIVQEALDRACKGTNYFVCRFPEWIIILVGCIACVLNGAAQQVFAILLAKTLDVDFRGEIKFNNVNFIYPTRPTSIILNKFQLDIKPSQRVALVGTSGCGKSTTIQLLERFYDTTGGRILLDGVDIRLLNIHWLRSQFGLVGQEPVLFDLTIAENIAYGLENIPMEDIINAARKANIHQFINRLPQGYETKVGLKGSFLSGGEKQRIAIARVLLRRPKVLLLDEATSAMDSHNEQLVQVALEQAQTEDSCCTSLIIAHRLSTIRSCDVIYVLDGGHIVERGTHTELIQKRGAYYKILTQRNFQ